MCSLNFFYRCCFVSRRILLSRALARFGERHEKKAQKIARSNISLGDSLLFFFDACYEIEVGFFSWSCSIWELKTSPKTDLGKKIELLPDDKSHGLCDASLNSWEDLCYPSADLLNMTWAQESSLPPSVICLPYYR